MNTPATQQDSPLVLVAEDDKVTRLQIRQMMQKEGYRVEEIPNGEQCLDAFTRLHPDIILLDAMMPVMDGFTCCAQLQTLPNGEHTPVLMITGLEDQASVDWAFEAGATDYITKPINWAVLRQRVRRLLREAKLAQQLEQANQELQQLVSSISESDLTYRIPVRGSDKIARLTITFNKMLDRLQAAFSSQQNFVNDVSHELRTPITIIQGHLELLGNDPEEQRETVKLVTDELDRMSCFVEDLLLLAKAERPDFLTLETLEIGSLIEELHAKARALASRNWILEAKGSGRIVVDRRRITQAIMNLAQNATQHTTEGDVIALGSLLTDGNIRFWVRDTGAGISLSDQERVFERFARAFSGRRSEGTGLGLSIVRAIAEAHGGRVELRSQLGAGATFTLVLPSDPFSS